MSDTFLGRLLYKFMKKQMAKLVEGREDSPLALLMDAMADEAPMRAMLMSADGMLTRGMLEGLLTIINGQFFKGAGELIRAARNK